MSYVKAEAGIGLKQLAIF